MLTLEWKITMSLSYYMAYQKKKNAMKEKDTYAKYYTILTSRKKKWPYLRKFLI